MLKNIFKRNERLAELIMVLSIAVLPIFFSSLFVYLGIVDYNYNGNKNAVFFVQIINQGLAILVLSYVLYKQDRNLQSIGLDFSWRDLYRGFFIMIAVNVSSLIFNLFLTALMDFTGNEMEMIVKNTDIFRGQFSLLFLLFLITNSFFEELIVRAYFISELLHFFNNKVLAVILCVFVQTSYHLYQGLYASANIAVVFLIFSIYFVKEKRIMPVILAHTYMNIISSLLG